MNKTGRIMLIFLFCVMVTGMGVAAQTGYAEFTNQWAKAVMQPEPDAFMSLLKSRNVPYRTDRIRLTRRSMAEIFLEQSLSPWLSLENDNAALNVVPGGMVKIRINVNFTTRPGVPRKATLSDVTLEPAYKFSVGEESHGWRQSRNGITGRPEMKGWITRDVWIKLPDKLPDLPVKVSLTAMSKGPHNGENKEFRHKKELIFKKIAEPLPQRENVLAMWAFAVRSGERSFLLSGTKQAELWKANALWADGILRRFATHSEWKNYVGMLQKQPEYVRNVAELYAQRQSPSSTRMTSAAE